MELLERHAELRALQAAVDRARCGRGATVLVSGEAGIGKTSLLTEFAARIAGTARVHAGACEALLTPRTLGPFRDMARASTGGALRGVAADDRDAVIDALLDELSIPARPAVVIVEDAHWADEASLDVVRYLARRIERLPALLVVSYRDDELSDDHPLRRVVGALAGSAVLHLELAGLSDPAVRQAAVAAGVDPEPVVAAVGGNPFYLSEVLASSGAGVPPSVRHAVLARIAPLPAACRRALEQLAVVPAEAESWLVDALLAGDRTVLADAERRGMIVATGGSVRFRHELARRAVELATPSSVRMSLHRAVLRALVSRGAVEPSVFERGAVERGAVERGAVERGAVERGAVEASRLVHHAVGAGDERAIAAYAAAAARESAAAGSQREAVTFALLGLSHRGDWLDACEVARLHGLAASALRALNRFNDARSHATEAVRLWDEAGMSSAELGEALVVLSRLYTMLADPDGAEASALRARDVLEPLGPSRALALCYARFAGQDVIRGRFDGALTWGGPGAAGGHRHRRHRGVREGRQRPRPGQGGTGGSDAEQGLADMELAVSAAERAGLADCLAAAAYNLAVAYLRTCRPEQAERYLRIAEQAADEHGLDAARFPIEAQWGHLLLWRGEWDEAQRRLRALLDVAAGAGGAADADARAGAAEADAPADCGLVAAKTTISPLNAEGDPGANLVLPLSFLARLLARRGDAGAAALADRAWQLAEATDERQKVAVAGGARIEVAWLQGDAAAVRAVGAELRSPAAGPGQEFLRGEVLRYLRRAGATVAPFPGCPPACAAGIAGDWASAAKLWAEAGNPYEEALELTEAPEPAIALRGLETLDRLGAVVAAAVVRRRLRGAGMRVPRGPCSATRANPGRLTTRQHDVLRLLADGRTNAEIAAQLYVSRRTVDNHVAALLARLGVGSRRAAAARAAELGLLRGPDPTSR